MKINQLKLFKIFDNASKYPDKKLLSVIITLIIFGWIFSFSASIGHFNQYSYAIKQGVYIVLGLGAGFLVTNISLVFFQKHATKIFIITLFLLLLVLIPSPISYEANGSRRWINLLFFNFQPSEMMKLVIILFMANFLIQLEKQVTTHPWIGLIATLSIIALPDILIMLETDLGATIMISAIALSMLFVAGTYIKQLSIVSLILFGMTAIYVWIDFVRSKRLLDFWLNDLWQEKGVMQTKQALIGIGRGDWSGTGLGAGIQKYTKLSEPHTDMIFAIIGEELGIIGMIFVLFSFAYIINKGFNIAKEALKHGRKYSSYVAFGICTWFSMQTGVNIAMNLGLIPIKGFTLPLISYGGSSLIMSIIALGFLLRIDMENKTNYQQQKNYV